MLLRPAQPADALAVARVHVRAWQAGYAGLLPRAYLDALRPEDRAARYTFGLADPARPATLVALLDGEIRWFATTRPADADAPRGAGELAALYVDPAWWGRGVGAALVRAARAALAERGFASAVLWVLAGNARAKRFYARDGWIPDGARRTVEAWGVTVDEERYVSSACNRSTSAR